MRLRNIPGAKEAIEKSKYVVSQEQEKREAGARYLGIRLQFI